MQFTVIGIQDQIPIKYTHSLQNKAVLCQSNQISDTFPAKSLKINIFKNDKHKWWGHTESLESNNTGPQK